MRGKLSAVGLSLIYTFIYIYHRQEKKWADIDINFACPPGLEIRKIMWLSSR